MTHLHLHTARPEIWRDTARRLRVASIASLGGPKTPVAAGIQAEVFDGPDEAQPAALERAFSAGHHVLVAAVPCLNRAALESLSAQAQTKHLQIAVWNPDRFLPSRQLIRKQIGASLGQTELVRSHRWDPVSSQSSAEIPLPLVGEIEQALWLVEQPVQRVFAVTTRSGAAGQGRHFQVHLAFDPGMALIDYDNCLPAGAGYRSLSVIGSSGSAQADDQDNVQLIFGGGDPRAITAGEGVRHLATMLDEFAVAVANRSDLSPSLNSCLATMAVAEAVQSSLKSYQAARTEGN